MPETVHDIPADPGDPLPEHPHILTGLAWIALAGPVIFTIAILIADVVVPDHDWISDTISDLGAGRYEFIVDIGIYAYAASLIALSVGSAHAHLGGRGWTVGIFGLIATGLVVFLIGARNEYGDGDSDGWVIHSYLVWGLGLAFAVIPWSMSAGMGTIRPVLRKIARGVTVVWIPFSPVFFLMGTEFDGLYERGLGLITFVFTYALAFALLGRSRALARRLAEGN
ncbi:DUF998 domain-containing protein [Jannaschia pohangensis]|uniref:DUF998 domain-containing protein n=1 Tax=Jannaschia pohangensis TaxID=390807 RepID=A0A1I3IN56_9RHOB|nr:DUF998 domain-containing protein [Jannaschia pohangensis]SFI49267.1 Protein of unknown function [Jannaschia pohangensis]